MESAAPADSVKADPKPLETAKPVDPVKPAESVKPADATPTGAPGPVHPTPPGAAGRRPGGAAALPLSPTPPAPVPTHNNRTGPDLTNPY
jgi:hypothetical protein